MERIEISISGELVFTLVTELGIRVRITPEQATAWALAARKHLKRIQGPVDYGVFDPSLQAKVDRL